VRDFAGLSYRQAGSDNFLSTPHFNAREVQPLPDSLAIVSDTENECMPWVILFPHFKFLKAVIFV
jgi:hypothetical protein